MLYLLSSEERMFRSLLTRTVIPDRFLGDQRASYNQDLEFRLRIGESGPSPTVQDVILEGAGLTITQTIFGQGNRMPSVEVHARSITSRSDRIYIYLGQMSNLQEYFEHV